MIKNVKDTEIYKLHVLISILDRSADEMLNSQYGLSYSQLMIMFMLDKYKQLNQKELSLCMGLTEAAVSKQIENMFHKEYLVREVDPKNRRKNMVFLTKSGQIIFDKANELLMARAEEIFQVLDSGEREILNKVLNKLLEQTNLLIPQSNNNL